MSGNEKSPAAEAGGSVFDRCERIADIGLDIATVSLAAAACLLPIALIVGMVAVMIQ